MPISQSYGTPDEAEGLATIRTALDLGVTLLDTADVYGPFTNETLVGRAIQGRRDEVVLASKCGLVANPSGGPNTVDGTPQHIKAACDASLERLGVRTIDLYYLHRVDPKVRIEVSVGAMADLVADGKIRHIGLSEVHADTLRRAQRVHPIAAVQSEYSLWTRDVETGVLPACRELGVGFVAFSPLGRGFLTGGVRSLDDLPENDFRRGVPRFQGENLARNLAVADDLASIAREKGCSAAQLALAWLLARGPDVVPIPGTKHPKYAGENAAAADLTLSAEELARIERATAPERIAGARYSAASMAMVDRGPGQAP